MHLVREGREDLDFYDALTVEDKRRSQRYSDFWLYTFNSTLSRKDRADETAFPSCFGGDIRSIYSGF